LPDVAWSLAQVCSVVASFLDAKGKSHPVSEFLPRVEPRKARAPRMEPAEMMAFLRAATGG
jgi:hypothetical protein